MAETSQPKYQIDPTSEIGQTLRGLDPDFALSRLSPRGLRTLELYFGLLGNEPITQVALAAAEGVTSQRVNQVKTQAMFRLHRLRGTISPERAMHKPARRWPARESWQPYPDQATIKNTWEAGIPDWSQEGSSNQ
jgi:hypothetical protein